MADGEDEVRKWSSEKWAAQVEEEPSRTLLLKAKDDDDNSEDLQDAALEVGVIVIPTPPSGMDRISGQTLGPPHTHIPKCNEAEATKTASTLPN